jgi:hypothetical protein
VLPLFSPEAHDVLMPPPLTLSAGVFPADATAELSVSRMKPKDWMMVVNSLSKLIPV